MVQLDRVAVAAVLVVQNTSKHLADDALAALQYAVCRRRGFEASIVLPRRVYGGWQCTFFGHLGTPSFEARVRRLHLSHGGRGFPSCQFVSHLLRMA